ncbi:MAG: dienelactone hydrolase family protein [Acidobacteria bacterium]|nr:dienelactone hydrolase family protein [Acidobacteriota bacterium]
MRAILRLCDVMALICGLCVFAFAQGPLLSAERSLAGFSYKELVENATLDAKGLPLIIALHWSGSSPEEFAGYISGNKGPVRILLLKGRYAHPRGGNSFYVTNPVRYYDMSADEKLANLKKEATALSVFIKAATKQYKPRGKPIITGASQGGDLSYAMAMLYPRLIAASFPMLATFDERILPKYLPRQAPPIYVLHGTADKIVPLSTAEGHVKALKCVGFTVDLKSYEGVGHDISEGMKADLLAKIATVLSPANK